MCHFIAMLTRDDCTVTDAPAVYEQLRPTPVRFVGFKDVGLPWDELAHLARSIKADGRMLILEVVSTSRDDELASVEAAARLQVDYVLGGRHIEDAVAILGSRGIRYFPFAGYPTGHPTRLAGELDDIVADARRLSTMRGVDGLDLLAWRSSHDGAALTRAVIEAVTVPVIVAGSIGDSSRIRAVCKTGAWGFTVGGAMFDQAFAHGSMREQVDAILGEPAVTA